MALFHVRRLCILLGRSGEPVRSPAVHGLYPRRRLCHAHACLAPASVVDVWKKTDLREEKGRRNTDAKRLEELDGQARRHFAGKGASVGKTRRVTAQGSAAGRNDITLYAIVQAESREAASKMFEDHPHLGIPQSSIEIMEIYALPGTF